MTFKLTLVEKLGYLHATVTGENSLENVLGYLGQISHECAARKCFSVLIEERLEGPRLSMVDVFQVASTGSRQATAMYKAIAYVDINAEGDLMRFAETVAVNRSLPVKIFPTVAEAEKWLLQKIRDESDTQ